MGSVVTGSTTPGRGDRAGRIVVAERDPAPATAEAAGAAAAARLDDQVGRRIGPYDVIAELARGGMGVVYLGRRAGEAGFERLVAIKEMHPHLATDHDFVAMLLDEGRLAARIHHHNVVSVLELERGERGYYLVMPYVEGCSLAQLLARNPTCRPASLIVPIMIGVLGGLHAAHTVEDLDGRQVGLIHRDVSPQNILVGVDGDARITDFGVAKARARITSTGPGMLKGKIAYTAPEMVEAATELDHRVDVFAAGAVLWSALTGRALFRGESDAETLRRILQLDIPPPSKVGLAPPAVFDGLVQKALARDPAHRFATAAAMAEALRDAALAAGLLGAPTKVARWVRETFAAEIDERHRQVRDAAARTSHSVIAVLPGFAEPVDATPAHDEPAVEIAAAPSPSASPSPSPSPPPPPIEVAAAAPRGELARFVLILALAFMAGVLATLYVRGLT